MNVKQMGLAQLDVWVGTLIQQHRVYAPQARDGHFVYDQLHLAADLRLDHDVTILPPKKYLMPPRETFLTFTRHGEFQPADHFEPMILFGVHPYDLAGIAEMDRYFSQTPSDGRYQARRRQTTIVGCDVQNPSPNIFAACMGTATAHDGCDVLLTRVGDQYVVEARSAAGEALLECAGSFEDADPVNLGRRQQVWLDAQKLQRRQDLHCRAQDLPSLLERSVDHPVWHEKSEKCFSCGSCVMVCPSCFCFDVKDDLEWDLAHGHRWRQWDACLLTEFALVAGGHNFRKDREARYRHRFYRKGAYLPARCGFVGCVGCGRCTGACTAGIANPVELYNALLEER
jgi:ferredoxin